MSLVVERSSAVRREAIWLRIGNRVTGIAVQLGHLRARWVFR